MLQQFNPKNKDILVYVKDGLYPRNAILMLSGKPHKASNRNLTYEHETVRTTSVPNFIKIGDGHVKKLLN